MANTLTTKLSPLATAILLTTGGTLCSGLAAAEEQPASFKLNKVTVAATRTEQQQRDVSSSVTVLDQEYIEATHAEDVRQLMRYEPSVVVGNANGQQSRFGAKGFNVRGLDENRVKITVDGIDAATSFTPSGNPFQRAGKIFLDTDSLKRVEVIKGPASTLYGSDALGGVVAFTTKDPADYLHPGDDTAGSIKLYYGDADQQFSQTLTLANRSGKLESLLVYTHRDSKELESHDDAEYEVDPQDNSSDNILAKLQYQLSDSHRIGLTVEDFSSDRHTDMPRRLASASYSDFYFGDDVSERQRVSFTHDWLAGNAFFDQLSWHLDWQNSETDSETHSMYGSPSSRYRIKDYGQEEDLWNLSAQFDKTLSNHLLTWGFEYQETEYSNRQDTLYPDDPGSNDINRAIPIVEGTTYGLYLQDQIKLLEGRLLVTPGIRFDSFEAEPKFDSAYAPAASLTNHDSDAFTARLGAVYKLTEQTALFAQYSQGFKAPDPIDIYYYSERNYGPGSYYLSAPNPDLEPEESDSFEVGLRYSGATFNVELAIFHNAYDNFIAEVNLGSTAGYDYVTQSQNINEATIEGVELRGEWLISAVEGLSLHASAAYTEGDNETDNVPLESIAPLTAVVGVGYDAPSALWGTRLDWTLVDGKDESDLADENQFAPSGYGLLDLTVYYQPIKSLTLRAGVFNLADKKYWVYDDIRGLDADDSDLERYIQPGRNFTASIKYTF